MKNMWILLLTLTATAPSQADVTRENGRVLLAYDFSEDHAIAVCIGFGYYRHECASVPAACGDGAPGGDPLPLVTRLASGDQRDICTGSETNPQCEAKISAHYGGLGLGRGHCTVADPNAVTPEEWQACEVAAAARGLAPSPELDQLPHFNGCLAFLDHKTGWPLREARDAGRTWLADDAAPDVDMTDDEP